MNLTFSAVRNLKWSSPEKTSIECEVMFNEIEFEEWTPFGASPVDEYAHGREIYDRAIAGDFGVIAEYTPPVQEVPVLNLGEAFATL